MGGGGGDVLHMRGGRVKNEHPVFFTWGDQMPEQSEMARTGGRSHFYGKMSFRLAEFEVPS